MTKLKDAHDAHADNHAQTQGELQKALDAHAADKRKFQAQLLDANGGNAASKAELEAGLQRSMENLKAENQRLKAEVARLKAAGDQHADNHAEMVIANNSPYVLLLTSIFDPQLANLEIW